MSRKKIKSLFRVFLYGIFLSGIGVAVPAQEGTKTPYIPLQRQYAPAPAGYSPVFVNYVGRHGARFLTKAGADMQVLQVLQAAEKSNGLTAAGKKIRVAAERIVAADKGKYENITLLGGEEQAAIGERVLYNYGVAFSGRGLTIETTWKLRTQQSADAFLRAFGKYTGKRRYERAPDSLETVLRFYDLSPGYLRYKKSSLVKKALDSLEKDARTRRTAANVWGRVFNRGYAKRSQRSLAGPGGTEAQGKYGPDLKPDAACFTDDLYDLFCIAFSMDGELRQKGYTDAVQDLGAAFTPEDLAWLDLRSGAADFLEKGPGYDSLGIQVKVAVPLLIDFIHSADEAVGGVGGDAALRFTHAEAIAPFAALLDIKDACSPAASIYRYQEHWRAESVIPLSANIQWVFYTDGPGRVAAGERAKHYLVKVLLNEREAVLPVATTQWPYYRWEDLRDYYVKKLGKLRVGLGDDMREYLQRLE